MEEVTAYLESKGFKVSRDFERSYYDKRLGKSTVTHRFQLYGHGQLVLWLKTIGFSSPKHLKKADLWRRRNLTHSRKKVREIVREIAGGGFEFGSGSRLHFHRPLGFAALASDRDIRSGAYEPNEHS